MSHASTSTAVPKKWVATMISSQVGKTAIVTGANSGIGYVTALELARHGANVVLACRSETKGQAAVQQIQQAIAGTRGVGRVEFRRLDVSSLASVEAFATAFKADHDRLDLLINNAGIMAGPYIVTADGIESQFATNHLGHFVLTSLLLDVLQQSTHAGVVSVASKTHENAKMDLNEIMASSEASYSALRVYANTKLYNLLFSFELNKRLHASGISNVIATTAHPGLTSTNLTSTVSNWFARQLAKLVWMLPFVQTVEFGALPTLYAAVGENIQPNDYIGPDGFGGAAGYPTKEERVNVSKSATHAQRLWTESERLAKRPFTI